MCLSYDQPTTYGSYVKGCVHTNVNTTHTRMHTVVGRSGEGARGTVWRALGADAAVSVGGYPRGDTPPPAPRIGR